jgi:8-oxo-dGTP pyrophosphatase MutT (NUDIX family)
MESFAAGIVPYTIINGNQYFLLGLERSNRKWSGFVGGSEPGELPIETALREFHEESALAFKHLNESIKEQLQNTLPVVDTTSSGKTVYIWFIRFPIRSLFMDFGDFYRFISNTKKREYREKL